MPILSEGRDTDRYTSHANVILHLIVVFVDLQHLLFGKNELEDEFTLSSYGIKSESTIDVVLKLAGGGGGWTSLAYAIVYHDWDGNMASCFFI
jgi:hypothetical protein